MNIAPQVKGWCPSVWQPMLTGDGYLVRLRFSCAIVTARDARAVAALSRRYGNGLIDLTQRANLQIRGVRSETIAALQAELMAHGLIAADDAGKIIPDVIASPLAGRDRQAVLDIRPVVHSLEKRLAVEVRERALPAKFSFVVDDGGGFSLRHLRSDIAFQACEMEGTVAFAAQLDGCAEPVGFIAAEQVSDIAVELTEAFTRLAGECGRPPRRMRDIVREVGVESVVALCPVLSRVSTRLSPGLPVDIDGPPKSGREVLEQVPHGVFALAAPFGSLHADQLDILAGIADRHAAGELRLTPWRAILLPGIIDGDESQTVAAACAAAGLIAAASDPRLHIAACSGAPGCASASVATRAVAEALARVAQMLSPQAPALHVSGCTKGCATTAPAAVTLVGREGRFDLVRNGRADDVPVLRGLSPAEAKAAIERIAEARAHV